MRVESSGEPDAWKLACPVRGWGRGETPRPTPRPTIGEFFVAKEATAIPAPKVVLNLSGGVLQDVFGSHSAITVVLVDWDVEGCSPSDDNIVELPDVGGSTQLAAVVEYPVWPLERLAGTETEAAMKAAGLTAGSDRTVARCWCSTALTPTRC